jgi:hypothetical protein
MDSRTANLATMHVVVATSMATQAAKLTRAPSVSVDMANSERNVQSEIVKVGVKQWRLQMFFFALLPLSNARLANSSWRILTV